MIEPYLLRIAAMACGTIDRNVFYLCYLEDRDALIRALHRHAGDLEAEKSDPGAVATPGGDEAA